MTDTPYPYPTSRHVSFDQAIALAFGNYFRFSGRSSRGAYWWFCLFLFLVSILCSIADTVVLGVNPNDPNGLSPLYNLFQLVTFIPGLAISVRRLHDIGKSGWWLLLILTIIGIIAIIYWHCQPGVRGDTPYGPDAEAGRDG